MVLLSNGTPRPSWLGWGRAGLGRAWPPPSPQSSEKTPLARTGQGKARVLHPPLLPAPSDNPVTEGARSPRLRVAEPEVRLEVVSPSEMRNVTPWKEKGRDVELPDVSARPARASGVTKGHWQ